MRLTVLNSIDDIVAHRLCSGCGACAYISPDRYQMIDTAEHGRRPSRRRAHGDRTSDRDAVRVCPGVGLEHTFDRSDPGLIRDLLQGWGPVLEVWEGHATDESIRFNASSGGATSAIAMACIEQGGMHGVLHIKARSDAPILNETVLSTTREEILQATGSRYAPASPCDGLALIENAPGPCVFIGKPCDVAAAVSAQEVRPALRQRIGVTIAFFCAGTPTTEGTMKLLERLGVEDPSDVCEVRYRGNGWPGRTVVTVRTAEGDETRTLGYEESWGEILTNHKQWRCKVCADHTGEFADIAVGDPWYRDTDGDPGRSLVLVRTERGRQVLRLAMSAGYLTLKRADPSILPASQPNLLRGRGVAWARILTCRLLGVPAPRYRGLPMFRYWWQTLTASEKIRSVAGTLRRILSRRLRVHLPLKSLEPRRHSLATTAAETRRLAA